MWLEKNTHIQKQEQSKKMGSTAANAKMVHSFSPSLSSITSISMAKSSAGARSSLGAERST
jgi:hypothetical protein